MEPPLTIDTLSSHVANDSLVRYDVHLSLAVTYTVGGTFTYESPAIFLFKQEPRDSGIWRLFEWIDTTSVRI